MVRKILYIKSKQEDLQMHCALTPKLSLRLKRHWHPFFHKEPRPREFCGFIDSAQYRRKPREDASRKVCLGRSSTHTSHASVPVVNATP